MFRILIVIALMCVVTGVHAEDWSLEKKQNIRYRVKTTKKSGRIIKREIDCDSICSNYPEGSIKLRHCMRQAQDLFADRCHKMRYSRATGKKREKVDIDRDMYCSAERKLKFSWR